MRRIVGGINIARESPALTDLIATDPNEVFAQLFIQAHQVAAIDPVFPNAWSVGWEPSGLPNFRSATICSIGSCRKREASLASS